MGRGGRLCYIPVFQKHVRVGDVAAASARAIAAAVNTNESLYVLGMLLLYRIQRELLKITKQGKQTSSRTCIYFELFEES